MALLIRLKMALFSRLWTGPFNPTLTPDHVHMYVSIPPKMSVAKVVGRIKGKSSLMIFDPKIRQTFLGKRLLLRNGGKCQ